MHPDAHRRSASPSGMIRLSASSHLALMCVMGSPAILEA
ncbi:hypothetical protein BTZ20_1763 [Rhodococcus sp. MTM3W5.2]|nr:hypothetical protein BTZ20_1763 [Rhodococcus sp. MTM3W5.2]